MNWKRLLCLCLALALALTLGMGAASAQELKKLTVSEPVHLIGYLPQSSGGNFFVLVIVWTAVSGWLFYITRNRHLAAALELLTVAASSAFFLLKSDALEGLFPDLLSRFNIMTAFNNAAYNSIFDVSGTVLQLTVIGVFLFLTVQSIEKRRWS